MVSEVDRVDYQFSSSRSITLYWPDCKFSQIGEEMGIVEERNKSYLRGRRCSGGKVCAMSLPAASSALLLRRRTHAQCNIFFDDAATAALPIRLYSSKGVLLEHL